MRTTAIDALKVTVTPVTTWTPAELDAVDGADELDLATARADGTLRSARIVWVVRHRDELYVRSVNGRDAAWFRGVQTRREGHVDAGGVSKDVSFADADADLNDALDDAYRRKYGGYPGPTAHITAAAARDTTLRLEPVTVDLGRPRTPNGLAALDEITLSRPEDSA